MAQEASLPPPERVTIALGALRETAREGLLALSAGVGLAVVGEIFEEEIAQVVGPRGKHEPARRAYRHGRERRQLTLGGRRVEVEEPRVRRTKAGEEVGLESYRFFASRDLLTEAVGSRSVHLAGCTGQPTGAWVAQQARNLAWTLQDGGLKVKFLLRDRDTKFSVAFDEVFRSEGLRVIHLPYRRSVANSIAERFVGTCRREVLDHLLIFGRGHLERVLGGFFEHYHHARPHQGLGQRRPCEPADVVPLPTGQVERRDRLGGLLHEYFRAA